MHVRRILQIAVLGGVLGAFLGGDAVQAQTSSQARFVSMLIMQEAKLILKNRNAIAQQNFDEQSLTLLTAGNQSAKVRKMISQLGKSINKLQNQINKVTAQLTALNFQTTISVAALPKPNPYTQPASINSTIIASFQARAPFGIPPATTIQ